MDDLAQKIAEARRTLPDAEQQFDGAWLDRQAQAFQSRRARGARRTRAGKIAAMASLALLVGAGAHRYRTPTGVVELAHQAPPGGALPITMDDGSSVTPFDVDTVYQLKASSPELAVVELVSGGARFQIAHRPSRAFRVEAGAALIEVLGTEFTVERIAGRVRVSVLSGQVQVTANHRTSQLVEGETGLFPRPAATEDPQWSTSPSIDGEDRPTAEHRGDGRPGASRSAPDAQRSTRWRALATKGNLGGAYQELEQGGWSIPDDAASLLLAADVARRTHHPVKAIAPLRRMLQAYPRDPRASAAAFTLGRVLMETGSHREAASSFAQAWSIEPDGVIAEDASAREIEAWARAGESSRARERAIAYTARYPKGRRLEAVRRYGGLE